METVGNHRALCLRSTSLRSRSSPGTIHQLPPGEVRYCQRYRPGIPLLPVGLGGRVDADSADISYPDSHVHHLNTAFVCSLGTAPFWEKAHLEEEDRLLRTMLEAVYLDLVAGFLITGRILAGWSGGRGSGV